MYMLITAQVPFVRISICGTKFDYNLYIIHCKSQPRLAIVELIKNDKNQNWICEPVSMESLDQESVFTIPVSGVGIKWSVTYSYSSVCQSDLKANWKLKDILLPAIHRGIN